MTRTNPYNHAARRISMRGQKCEPRRVPWDGDRHRL